MVAGSVTRRGAAPAPPAPLRLRGRRCRGPRRLGASARRSRAA
jgi:hypothetical protein